MLTLFGALTRRLFRFSDNFAEGAGRILSWSIWLTLSILGIGLWIIVHDLTHARWDPHYDNLVLVLTITTALDAAAAKVFQLALRRADEKREAHQVLQMDAIADLTVAIKDELDRSKERDEAAAVRDDTLRSLITKLLDMVTNLEAPDGH